MYTRISAQTCLRKQEGQTIIELLIAVTLIILFLSGIVVVELNSIKNVEFARRKSTASKLAREQLERARVIRDSSGTDSMAMCLLTCYIHTDLTLMPQSPQNDIFQTTLTMQDATAADCPGESGGSPGVLRLYVLHARVSWQQGNADSTKETVVMSSCLRERQ